MLIQQIPMSKPEYFDHRLFFCKNCSPKILRELHQSTIIVVGSICCNILGSGHLRRIPDEVVVSARSYWNNQVYKLKFTNDSRRLLIRTLNACIKQDEQK